MNFHVAIQSFTVYVFLSISLSVCLLHMSIGLFVDMSTVAVCLVLADC